MRMLRIPISLLLLLLYLFCFFSLFFVLNTPLAFSFFVGKMPLWRDVPFHDKLQFLLVLLCCMLRFILLFYPSLFISFSVSCSLSSCLFLPMNYARYIVYFFNRIFPSVKVLSHFQWSNIWAFLQSKIFL